MNKNKPFFWGASTASHQVEGGTVNQWSEWELSVAAQSAKDAERRLGGLPNWPDIKDQATDPNNYVSGRAVDHYRRYKEDFDYVTALNLDAFRFTVEWSRIEPEEGKFDIAEIKHYKEYIAELKKRGIEPFLNIWHWTEPTWFTEKGGFTKRKNIKYFDAFVDKVTTELLNDVTYVITLNEVNSYATFGYMVGKWPPGRHNILDTMRVYYNLMLAHKSAYKIIKKHKPTTQVGVAHQATNNAPANTKNPINMFIAWAANYIWHIWFFNRINNYQDFVGANYYFTNYMKSLGPDNPKTPINDMGWYMEPDAIYDVIMDLDKRYNKPIFITENGVADANDTMRKWWLEKTMIAMDSAITDGAQLQGYFHWSLLDNFEWDEGWWPKFGLISVDRSNNMKRTIKPSAIWWAKEIAKRKI